MTSRPAWKDVNGFVGVAAEVRDVRMVMEALRMAVDWVVVDCEDGTADASVVIWETMFSTAFDLPEAGIPLCSLASILIVTVISSSLPYDDGLHFCPSPSMFPYTVCEFSHAGPLFLGDAIVRVRTREADETRAVEPDGGLAILVSAVEGRQEAGCRGPAGACSSSGVKV